MIYNSTYWSELEYKDRYNATAAAQTYLRKHPELRTQYLEEAKVADIFLY